MATDLSQSPEAHRRLHRDVWELLPWYVNQTLEPAERERVEAHLATCITCRSEVVLLRQLERHVRDTDVLDDAVTRSLSAVRGRIAAAPRGDAPGLRHRLAAAGALWRRSPGAMKAVVATQTAVIVAGLGVLGTLPAASDRAPTFQTLSSDRSAAAPGQLRVKVAEGVGESQLRALLVAQSLRIVDGPSPTGVYTLAVADGGGLALAVARLRAAPELSFVAPVSPPGRE